ncbi:hypothetical protein Nos7107_2817 [Nostoc sp. PCC 7107]|nr:hypothetical protein Nos7107_2817 [Nostoc sp. PCC 7107]
MHQEVLILLQKDKFEQNFSTQNAVMGDEAETTSLSSLLDFELAIVTPNS